MKNQMTFQRYEFKYLMDLRQLQAVLSAMAPYMVPDEYSHSSIRNLYLDTPDYRLIRRSLERPVYKEKLRVRSYDRAGEQAPVFVELKKKYQSVVYKRRISLPQEQALACMEGRQPWPDSQIGAELAYTMDFYKKIHGIVYTRFQNNIPYTLGGMSGYRALAVQNDQLLFADSSDLTLSMVGMDYCGLLALEQNPVAFGLPNINGGKTPAYTAQCAAIRKTSENKANAYEFIKILLSQTIQGDASDHIGGIDIPVHNDARMQKIKAFMQETVKNIGVTDGVACQPITTEQAEQLYRLFSEVSCIHSYSADVCGILWKDMLPYFEGTASYDKCVKNLKNDLTLYVAE